MNYLKKNLRHLTRSMQDRIIFPQIFYNIAQMYWHILFLYVLFNNLLLTGQFPSEWKESYITPIQKGDNIDINNCKPVCIQSGPQTM